jgi:hypothetical protein
LPSTGCEAPPVRKVSTKSPLTTAGPPNTCFPVQTFEQRLLRPVIRRSKQGRLQTQTCPCSAHQICEDRSGQCVLAASETLSRQRITMLGRSRAEPCQMIGCTAICRPATSTFKGIGCCPGPRNAAGHSHPLHPPGATQGTVPPTAECHSYDCIRTLSGCDLCCQSTLFRRVMSSHCSCCGRSSLPPS